MNGPVCTGVRRGLPAVGGGSSQLPADGRPRREEVLESAEWGAGQSSMSAKVCVSRSIPRWQPLALWTDVLTETVRLGFDLDAERLEAMAS